MSFLALILAIAAFVVARGAANLARDLSARIGGLENQLAARVPSAAPEAADATKPPPPRAPTPHTDRAPYAPAEPAWPSRLVEWIQEDWLMKLGALLLVLGFLWLTTYAFLNNWIGPAGRITLGLASGAAFLALGWHRTGRSVPQGGVLFGLGSAVVLVTVLAARTRYGFFTPISALAIMFLSASFVSAASALFRLRSLAVVGLISGGLAPMMLGAADRAPVLTFAYLFLVVLASLSVMVALRWRVLTVLALIIVALHSAPFGGGDPNATVILLIAYAFGALFLWAGLLATLRWDTEQEVMVDTLTAVGNGLLLLMWTTRLVPLEWRSLAVALIALAFAGAAYYVQHVTRRREPFFIYGAAAAGLLGAATSIELSGATLGIALSLEAAGAILAADALTKSRRAAELTSLLLVIPGLLALNALEPWHWRSGLVHREFFLVLLFTVLVFGLAVHFRARFATDPAADQSRLPRILTAVGSLSAAGLVWRSTGALFDRPSNAVMAALFVYTGVGIVAYVVGKSRDDARLRLYGSIFLGAVAVRLLVVDVWQMELSGRIVTFFVVGLVLLGSGFVGRRSRRVALLLASMSAGGLEAQQPDSSTRAAISAFRSVTDLPAVAIAVPTVLEIPLGAARFSRNEFLVFDLTDGRAVPSVDRRSASALRVVATTSSTVSDGVPDALTDSSERTTVEFPVPDSGVGRAVIALRAERAVRSAAIELLLPQNVSYPTTVEVRARVGADWRIVVATRKVESTRIEFPVTTASEWRVTFDHAQPLRIAQLALDAEEDGSRSTGTLRFLALPAHRYRLYLDADRAVDIRYPEGGDLDRDRGVRQVALGDISSAASYTPADGDADGIPDVTDNCVSIPNEDQRDADANARGDACDDFDRDGVINSRDNCPDAANRSQADEDADGIGDVCDDEESRITERFGWLPWVGMFLVGGVLAMMFVGVVRRTRGQ